MSEALRALRAQPAKSVPWLAGGWTDRRDGGGTPPF